MNTENDEKNSLDDHFSSSLSALQTKITNFQEQNQQKDRKIIFQKHSNVVIVYNIFADLLAGVITAFILNKIYTFFFKKSTLVLALLLVFCIIGGFLNTIRLYIKENNFQKKTKENC